MHICMSQTFCTLLWCMIFDGSSLRTYFFNIARYQCNKHTAYFVVLHFVLYSIIFYTVVSYFSQVSWLPCALLHLKCKLICSMTGVSVSMGRRFLAQQSSETCIVQVAIGQPSLILSNVCNSTLAWGCTIHNPIYNLLLGRQDKQWINDNNNDDNNNNNNSNSK